MEESYSWNKEIVNWSKTFSNSTVIRAESAVLVFFFVLAFADAAIIFGDHISLEFSEGTRLISNFIGLKSMSYWTGVVLADYVYGIIPVTMLLFISLAGVLIPQIIYFWIQVFAGFFFWFQYLSLIYITSQLIKNSETTYRLNGTFTTIGVFAAGFFIIAGG